MTNPVLVNSWRGDIVENRHRGAIAVCDARGRLLHAWGDVDALVYPRSAIKLLQALPLLESGAADHFELDPAELALACSSHSAENRHTDAVLNWLRRLDLDPGALECGPTAPLHTATAENLLRQHQDYSPLHNCCSGKHTGMLTISRFLGEATQGYSEREHPAQQRWFDALGEMADIDMRRLPWNRDGCGIPVIAMPLTAIATAFARVAAPDDLAPKRAAAVERLTNAIAGNPFMIAGSGRLGYEVNQLCGDRILVKSGAAGVYTAVLRSSGLGLALKIDDGDGAASEVALIAVLRHLQQLRTDELEHLGARIQVPICNTRAEVTGYRRAVDL